jgi:hypothetical protein
MTTFRFVSPALALIFAGILPTEASAESFNAVSVQVVTHRGSDLQLVAGVNKIDRKNTMTCASDAGCSLVVETNFVSDWKNAKSYNEGIICTYVDHVAADPGCVDQTAISASTLMSFQGKPDLPKGTHVVQTTFTVPSGRSLHMSTYQLVYTLYQHQ